MKMRKNRWRNDQEEKEQSQNARLGAVVDNSEVASRKKIWGRYTTKSRNWAPLKISGRGQVPSNAEQDIFTVDHFYVLSFMIIYP
jgi:hypothetical protein